MKLDFDEIKEDDVRSVESRIKDVYLKLCDADTGTLNEICEVMATNRSSLTVLHDFIEKAVLSKYAILLML